MSIIYSNIIFFTASYLTKLCHKLQIRRLRKVLLENVGGLIFLSFLNKVVKRQICELEKTSVLLSCSVNLDL